MFRDDINGGSGDMEETNDYRNKQPRMVKENGGQRCRWLRHGIMGMEYKGNSRDGIG